MRERIRRIIRKLERLVRQRLTLDIDPEFNVYEFVHSPGETWPAPLHAERVMSREELIAKIEEEGPSDIFATVIVNAEGRCGWFNDRLNTATGKYEAVGWAAGGPTLLEAAREREASIAEPAIEEEE